MDLVSGGLLASVVKTARAAGEAILEVRRAGELGTSRKSDGSPVTQADVAANRVTVAGLNHLTPEVPIVSEESWNLSSRDRRANPAVWLVDPLDGTRGFIRGSEYFTVNIALVEAGEPVLGVVYAPALDLCYYGGRALGAWRQSGGGAPEKIAASRGRPGKPVVMLSHAALNSNTKRLLAQIGPHRKLRLPSALKLGYVADGTADLYPRLLDCQEWDTAAGDAVLREAGGRMLAYDSWTPLVYNKPDLASPWFVAAGGGDCLATLAAD
jgi:3'(2'), 5'-bisphosphate nucleotidase